ASIFGTALGTVLLAIATGFLGLQTVEQSRAARDEFDVSRRALLASSRPLLVDVPERRGERNTQVEASSGQFVDADTDYEAGYLRVRLPFKNAGQGLALIRGATLVTCSVDFGSHADWSLSADTAVAKGEVGSLELSVDLDFDDPIAGSA